MKIALISRSYPLETGIGGIPSYIYNLAHGLSLLGHEVHVVTQASDEEEVYCDDDVFVHLIKGKTLKLFHFFNKSSFVNVLLYRFRIRQEINHLIKINGIDIVEYPDWVAEGIFIVLWKISSICVCRIHGLLGEKFHKVNFFASIRYQILCWLEKISIKRGDVVVAATNFHAKKTSNICNIALSKIEVIPLGVSLPAKEEIQIKRNKSTLNVLYAGRLEEEKGTKYLMEAILHVLSKTLNVNFSLVGKDLNNKYQTYFKETTKNEFLGRVDFHGHVSPKEVNLYYQNCDIFVSPSLSETFGLTNVEAMSFGKPVIAFDVCGASSIIENEKSGILVDPCNSEKLAEAILRLINNSELRQEMGKCARYLTETKFSVDIMAKNMEELYEFHLQKKE